MPEKRYLPNIDKISTVAAAILLTYTLARFVSLPSGYYSVQLPGLFLEFRFDAQFFTTLLVAGLTATGADWLVRDHPSFTGRLTIQHWLLPALTAWAIGVVLFQQPFGGLWGIVFVVGGFVLILVLIAEYVVIEPVDVFQIPATIGLTALAFALFLILTISVRASEARLFVLVPTITIAVGLTSLRALHLRLQGKWAFTQTGIIAILLGQLSAALNYLPIDPVSFGLILLGPAYALTSAAGGMLEGRRWQQNIAEPVGVLGIVLGIALLLS